MPNQTPNLNLTKPLQTEYYNIDVHNANSDIIDTAIGSINTDKSDKLTAGNAIVLTKDAVAKTVNVAVDPNLVSNHNTDANAHSGVLAKLAGAIFTGDVSVLTPDAADNTQKPANTSWIRSQMQSLVSGCIGSVATAAGFEVSAQTNGYIKLPFWLGGIVLQWGTVTITASTPSGGAQQTSNLPVAFPNAGIMAVVCRAQNSDESGWWGPYIKSITSSQITIGVDDVSTSTAGNKNTNYFAVGY